LVITRERMLRFIRHYEDTIEERLAILISFFLEIYWSTRMPKITKIELDLTKLLQK